MRPRRSNALANALAKVLASILATGLPPAAQGQPLPDAPAVPPPAPAPAVLTGTIAARGSLTTLGGSLVQAIADRAAPAPPVVCDDAGRFRLSLPAGRYTLLVSAPDHLPQRLPLTLRPGDNPALTVRLVPRGRPPFSATVTAAPREGQRVTIKGEELRTLPGTLGDPFRVLGLLPGVATPLPLLPLYVIRGASPGMNGFFLDGLRVPQLFHLLVGGGVVHATLVEELSFYPGAYDSSFGHFAGGVIDAHTRPGRPGQHGEVELRLFDVSAALEFTLPRDVHLTVSGHYGYPGPLVRLFDDRVGVSYWDYQARLDVGGFTAQALGSYDSVTIVLPRVVSGMTQQVPQTYEVMFHRVQLRQRLRRGRLSAEAALFGGYDDMTIFQGYGVRKLSTGLRASLS